MGNNVCVRFRVSGIKVLGFRVDGSLGLGLQVYVEVSGLRVWGLKT